MGRARIGCTALVLGLVALAGGASAAGTGLKELGFEPKEIKALEGLGVAGADDLAILKEADYDKITGLGVVELRKLEKKARAAGAIWRIQRLDAHGVSMEMAEHRLERNVMLEGAKAYNALLARSSRSPTKIEKMGKEDGVTFGVSRVVDMYPGDAELVAYATAAMAKLATTDESKIMIGALGGMDAVVNALVHHYNNSDVMIPAMELLAKISSNEKIKNVAGKEDAFQAILKSIPMHYETKDSYVEVACLALWQLTTPHQYCLHMAAHRGMVEEAKALIKAGLDQEVMFVKDEQSLYTPLHVAVSAEKVDVVRMMLKFVDSPALLVEKEKIGWTVLHIAAALGNTQILTMLLKKGGDALMRVVDAVEAAMPIHTAAQRGKLEVVKFLLEKDPSLARERDGALNTMLHLAAANGQKETVEYLIGKHMTPEFQEVNEMGHAVRDLSELNKHYGVTAIIDKLMPKKK
mmetsp:Transcript_36900/g.90819  ORF Transcript_36900/g.90819 Transcript_36900/m.90819 type:complete len:465 (+) Transcript_36900:38-1432(+)